MFEAIARTGSIRKAGLALGLDHAGVSRHLKELEAWIGAPLMERARGSRGRLTAAGMRCHARVAAALSEIACAGSELRADSEHLHLPVHCAHDFASKWLVPRLDEFRSAHPDIRLSIIPTEDSPDLAAEARASDIRFVGDWAPPRTVARVETGMLHRPRVFPAVGRSFLSAAMRIGNADDVKTLPLLFAQDLGAWRTWLIRQGSAGTSALRGIHLGNSLLAIEAAKHGRGIALVDELTVAEAILAGDLFALPIGQRSWPRISIGSYTLQAREECWHREPLRTFRRWLRISLQRDSVNQ